MENFAYEEIIQRILSKNRWGNEGELAKQLGISANTWTAYKRGKRSFGLHEIAKICDALEVSSQWLLFGAENSGTELQKQERQDIDPDLMRKLGQLVEQTFKEEDAGIKGIDLTVETTIAYNDLRSLIDDPTDIDAVKDALPLVKRRLRKRLAETANNPANRKHSA